MHQIFFFRALFLAISYASLGQADCLTNSKIAAASLLSKWYNSNTGIWDTAEWWHAGNIVTTLGDLAAISPDVKDLVSAVFSNTFNKAPKTHPNFLNEFYDDEGWWALGWIKAYDITREPEYLQAAADIFEDMTKAWDTPCGGIWWDKKRTSVYAIANELFFSVAASLANREPDRWDYYLGWAERSRDWFERSGLINEQGLINDGIDLKTCKNDGDTVWSYNQGVILGAYVELAKTGRSASALASATSIASAAIANLSDPNQILRDVCEPNCDNTAAYFTGIFMRNLGILQRASPRPEFATFIKKNADSIWANNRLTSDTETLLGPDWSGPYRPATAATQGSALDALVAAAAIA